MKKNSMRDWKKILKFIVITAAFAILILIAFYKVYNMSVISDKDFITYHQGLEYLEKKDYENAYFNFSNVSKTSALYEIALLRQALCADELKDTETAVKKYHFFIERFPESMFIEKVYYALAQNYFRQEEFKKAEKTFNAILKNYPESDYKTASNYYLGLISKEKNPLRAKMYFLSYIKDAPDGRYAINSLQELLALKIPVTKEPEKNQTLFENLTLQKEENSTQEQNTEEIKFTQYENKLIGRAFFMNGMYNDALEFLNLADMKTNWHYLYIIYKNLKQNEKANEIFINGYMNFSINIEDKELYKTLDTFAASYPAGEKHGWYRALELAKENKAKGCDYILYKLSLLEDNSIKNIFYKEIFTDFPNSKFAPESLANLFWNEYQKGNYQEALKIGRVHLNHYSDSLSAPRVTYWMGKISEKTNNRNMAKTYYQRVMSKYPDTYYAFRSHKKLGFHKSHGWATKPYRRLPEEEIDIHFPIEYTSLTNDKSTLINTILKTGDFELLNGIEDDNKVLQSWLNYKRGKFATSGTLARDAIEEMPEKPSFSDNIYKLAYQLHYQELINKYGQLYNIDSYLIAALIREESYYNAKAGSGAGAKGLMQLMPSTANYIAHKSGIRYNYLLDPEDNIKLGCAYIDYLKNSHKHNDLFAIASYNGGPNAVSSWKENLDYENFDEFVENIPYPETRDYVKKVFRTYWIYTNIY